MGLREKATEGNGEVGLMYFKIIQDKVNSNGEYMYKDIPEVPNKYENALKEFISPTVRAYGISLTGGGFFGLSGNAGIAYDDKGRVNLIWTVEGSGNAPVHASMLSKSKKGGLNVSGFYSESYDAINVDDISGDIVNVYDVEIGHILTAGKSKGKSVPDDSGKQTTWTTVKYGTGTIIKIGASGSRTYSVDIKNILNE